MARATGQIARSTRNPCNRSSMHTARPHTRNPIPFKDGRIHRLRNLQEKQISSSYSLLGRPFTAVIPVIEPLFSAPYDRRCMHPGAGERCSAREFRRLIFVHVDVFVRVFDSQQRTQATQRTKLSLLVRTESDREYGRCPVTSRRRQHFSRRSTRQPLWIVNCTKRIHS
jgi:hypothetical protein